MMLSLSSVVMRGHPIPFPETALAPRHQTLRAAAMNELQPLLPVVAIFSLAAATLVSEDLTCVAAGVLVADGRVPFAVAVGACLLGIVAGDLVLMLAGRALGRTGFDTPFARRLVSPETIARSSRWMQERGAVAVSLSRFVPGTRLATYLAAGALGVGFWKFALYVSLSALVWVPALVGLSAVAGAEVVEAGLLTASGWAGRGIVVCVSLVLALKAAAFLARWKSRRRLYGLWQRWTRWEFWPLWVFYPPVLVYVMILMIRHRSLTVFTAANPDIPGGGFIGESKFEILRRLSRTPNRVARAALVPGDAPPDRRAAIARAFMDHARLSLPVVVKPDQGQRGAGVAIVRSERDLDAAIASLTGDIIVQEYIPGLELGVFYYRHPHERRGRIFSITEKRFPSVQGDGRSTLEALILADERAVCLSPVHARVHAAHLHRVPGYGESVPLVEIGSHCRGALFLDASHLVTPALEDAFDAVAQEFGGFYFGRFDVRTPSLADFTERSVFTVLELNGVTSESTNIYDPGHSLWRAYRVLAAQWRLAFEIGAENRRRGVMPASLLELVRLGRRYRQHARAQAQVTA